MFVKVCYNMYYNVEAQLLWETLKKNAQVRVPVKVCRKNIFFINLSLRNFWGLNQGLFMILSLLLIFMLHQKHSFVE